MSAPNKGRLAKMSLAFGSVWLIVGAVLTWMSYSAAQKAGAGDIEIFWAAIIAGTILCTAGGVIMILEKS